MTGNMDEVEVGRDNRGEEERGSGSEELEVYNGVEEHGRLYTIEELKDLVGALKQKLKKRDEEIRKLKVEQGRVIVQKEKLEKTLQDVAPRMAELEHRLFAKEKEIEDRVNALMRDFYGEGAVGGDIASTPKAGSQKKDWGKLPSEFI